MCQPLSYLLCIPEITVPDHLAGVLQIQRILKPSQLKKPRAHLVLNIAGWRQSDAAALFSDRQQQLLALPSSCLISDITGSVYQAASANPDVRFTLLDHVAIESCEGSGCMARYLEAVAESVHACLSGTRLTLSSGSVLDLSRPADKLFAAELASLHAGLQQHGKALRRRMERRGEQEDVEMYELTMVGLQSVVEAYGPGSEEDVAARAAVQQVLAVGWRSWKK